MKYLARFCFSAIVLLFAANVFAGGFEGIITMEVSSKQLGDKKPMTISCKGDKTVIQTKSEMGEIKLFTNKSEKKITMVMEASKMGMVMDMDKLDNMVKSKMGETQPVVATGKKSVINGYNCELYTSTGKDGKEVHMLMTSDLPKSLVTSIKSILGDGLGAMSRNHSGPNISVFEELFNKGLMPAQIITMKDGETEGTVTFVKFEEKKISDSFFEVPSDIQIMKIPGMPGQ